MTSAVSIKAIESQTLISIACKSSSKLDLAVVLSSFTKRGIVLLNFEETNVNIITAYRFDETDIEAFQKIMGSSVSVRSFFFNQALRQTDCKCSLTRFQCNRTLGKSTLLVIPQASCSSSVIDYVVSESVDKTENDSKRGKVLFYNMSHDCLRLLCSPGETKALMEGLERVMSAAVLTSNDTATSSSSTSSSSSSSSSVVSSSSSVLSSSATSLSSSSTTNASTPSNKWGTQWWENERKALVDLCHDRKYEQQPLYVYSAEQVARNIKDLQSIKSVNRLFYAMKANNCEDILRIVEKAGMGIECVSIFELKHVQKLLGLKPERILFTPNFASRDEYKYALEEKTFLTLDSVYPLQMWGEMFRNASVLVRLDSGAGAGHHSHVRTGGHSSKFGVSLDQFPTLLKLIDKYGVKVIGLHIHAGSGIFETDNWLRNATFMCDVRKNFPYLKYLNLGGGLGVPYNPSTQTPLDLAAVDRELLAAKKSKEMSDLELWMEPGRFVVANAGVLLAKVTQIKSKGASKHFVGCTAGMNTLIRPALYNSYHHIVNISRSDSEVMKDPMIADIVGPICETGDCFGHDRELPCQTCENDVLLIATTGAYGHTMSSTYNMRPNPPQVLFKKQALS